MSHDFSVTRFSACLGPDTAVGAVRLSLGYPTVQRDLDRTIAAIQRQGAVGYAAWVNLGRVRRVGGR